MTYHSTIVFEFYEKRKEKKGNAIKYMKLLIITFHV
jgi:hypothetical protein